LVVEPVFETKQRQSISEIDGCKY